MTQNLKGVYKLIPALSIIPKKILSKTKNVIGFKPFKLLISNPKVLKLAIQKTMNWLSYLEKNTLI